MKSKLQYRILLFSLAVFGIPASLFSQTDIYHRNYDQLMQRKHSATIQQRQKSKRLLQKALSYHKKKKNWRASLVYYQKSIQLYPMARAFYELGNAHMNLREYPKAIRSFSQAISLSSAKTHLAYYNIACCYSLQKDTSLSLAYLEKAFRYGYYSFRYTLVDADLAYARKSGKISALIKRYNNTNRLSHLLIGSWYGAPVIAERSPDVWEFKLGGTFAYWYDANNTLDRRVSMTGTWKVKGNVLYLSVTKRQDRVGGKVVASDVHPGERVIRGARQVTRNVRQRVRRTVSHVIVDDKFNLGKARANVLIQNKLFWKAQ